MGETVDHLVCKITIVTLQRYKEALLLVIRKLVCKNIILRSRLPMSVGKIRAPMLLQKSLASSMIPHRSISSTATGVKSP
jgi:hypothetical protein